MKYDRNGFRSTMDQHVNFLLIYFNKLQIIFKGTFGKEIRFITHFSNYWFTI